MSRPEDATGAQKLQRYKLLRQLGSGGFAEVGLYSDTLTGTTVAIKRVRKESFASGVNLGGVKELCVLQELRHQNIIALTDVFVYAERLHLVLTLCICDLTRVIRDRSKHLGEAHVKCVVGQLLDAVEFTHRRGFMHRDIKPDNVLITREGCVQLADFGHAARMPEPDATAYPGVVTLWYRAPELLFRSPLHGPAVDMWAVGCVLAEVLLRQPLFPGRQTEADQLAQIFRLLGAPVDPVPAARWEGGPLAGPPTGASPLAEVSASVASCLLADSAMLPDEDPGPERAPNTVTAPSRHDPTWPGCSVLPGYMELEARPAQLWRAIFPASIASDAALDLLRGLLVYDPARRLSAAEARRHPWFSVEPRPCAPADLPLPSP